ncbi:MAG: DUF1178 family protein [Deltaproteobacteria bacterium]|nr:DUF1178 family protein [Deltaproteobacteria bacterium]MBW2020236.1 DUF1178 family protein [Deltaproteobacteria bacterium]MBW2075025.1 DUF1178 family protein [Deltaproteobacteria bacterium]
MIVYDLQCANGHTFEGWFEDRKAYEDQSQKKLIVCPVCNETSVVSVPSRFSIKAGPTPSDKGNDISVNQAMVEKVMDFLENNFEDVGANFSREALKMHYNVTEKRNIRGTSTEAEEEILKQEGIKFFKLPIPRLDS